MATIVVVEDEPAIRELIGVNLERAGYGVVHAGDAESAIGIIREVQPDLVLIDWMLPRMSGEALARQLRQNDRTRDLPLIMLTARSGESDKLAGLEAGADDYVTKPFSPRELVARIAAVLRGRPSRAADDPVEIAGLRLETHTRRVYGHGRPLALGPIEFRLLRFFMTHRERVYSRAQILGQVWSGHAIVEDRTIDVHIRRLRKALEPSGHDRLVETVRGSGYRFSISSS